MTQKEFEIIYSSLKSRLTSLSEQFRRNTAADLDPDDIVQEAMIGFWQLCEEGYKVNNPTALLVKITKNICISRYRKQKLRTETIPENHISEDSASSVLDRMDEKTIKEKLYQSLTKTERDYMLLMTEEGMSLDEIADITGNSKPSISTALSKARKKLAEQFKRNGYDK